MYLVKRYDYERDLDLNIVSDEATELVDSQPADSWMQALVMLDALHAIASAAYEMPERDVISQVNSVNGGELLILCAGSGWQSRSHLVGPLPCPTCGHRVPHVRNVLADHAPGASDPYS